MAALIVFYLALNRDLSISLTRLSVNAVCVCSMVNVTYVWNGIAHLAGSLYMRSYFYEFDKENKNWPTFNYALAIANDFGKTKKQFNRRSIQCQTSLQSFCVRVCLCSFFFIWRQNCHTHLYLIVCAMLVGFSISLTNANNNMILTKRLIPFTLRHFSTGSACKHTSSYLRKWFRNVVFPAPILPSINTVNGCLLGDVIFGITFFIILVSWTRVLKFYWIFNF